MASVWIYNLSPTPKGITQMKSAKVLKPWSKNFAA